MSGDVKEVLDLAKSLDPKVYDDFCEINFGMPDPKFKAKLKQLVETSLVVRYVQSLGER